jgi:F-type H+-transporting ATPase subunit alpha
MSDLIRQLTNDLQNKIDTFETRFEVRDIWKVREAGDGIAIVQGLDSVHSQELVQFENGVMGIAFNLERDQVGVILLGDYSEIGEGMKVHATGRIASVPVGDGLIGRVVNSLGDPIDGKGNLPFKQYRPIERIASGVIERQDVDTPVQTGIIAIDAMIPIGRGQRELIIGDRQTGKTAIAIDTIINQRRKDLICIYVAIGQKKAAVARTIATLEKYGAMEHTIVVVASADEPAAMQYIAPYAGCAIGEDFMERGRDALIVYDDLSKHAWAYRQVSLLLRRPPGREAYPGDVFYLHSRLLERAARIATSYLIVSNTFTSDSAEPSDGKDNMIFEGPRARHAAELALQELPNAEGYKIARVEGTGGSLTALPIIETLLGDVSAYIPTNVISITDGQIYLENNLFNAGIRPAINVGISVSRVGGSAQTRAIRQVAARLRLDMASYRDLAGFAQFGSDLDKATQDQLTRGQRLQEVLKQPQYEPMSLAQEVVLLFASTNGFADFVLLEKMQFWRHDLLRYIDMNYPEVARDIEKKKQITKQTEALLRHAIDNFTISWK